MPIIDPLPQAPDPGNRATFNALAYAWSSALPHLTDQINAQFVAPLTATFSNSNFELTLSTASSHSLASVVVLDSTRTLLLTVSSASIHAVVYNTSTKTFGSPSLVRSGSALASPSAILCGSDSVLVASSDGTAFQAVVISTSGTSIASVGTPVSASFAGMYMQSNGIAVGSSFVFATNIVETSPRLVAITVSGTVPTIGSPLTMSSSTIAPPVSLLIDSTRVLWLGGNSSGNMYATVVTVSGTALSAGSIVSTACTGNALVRVKKLNDGRFAVVYYNSGTYGAIITISGTVPSFSVVSLGGTGITSTGTSINIGDQIIAQTSTTTLNVLTNVSGVATAGTAVTITTIANGSSCCGYGPDYAVFGGAGTFTVAKIVGNNPVIVSSESVSTSLAVSPAVSAIPDNNFLGPILAKNGKSGPALMGSSQSPLTISYGGSGANASVNVAFGSTTFYLESPSVLWSSSNVPASFGVRVYRVEVS